MKEIMVVYAPSKKLRDKTFMERGTSPRIMCSKIEATPELLKYADYWRSGEAIIWLASWDCLTPYRVPEGRLSAIKWDSPPTAAEIVKYLSNS